MACLIYMITQKTSDMLWTMLRNNWKHIFNGVPWFLTKSKNVYAFSMSACQSVCPSDCLHPNSCKYFSNFLTFMHTIHIWYRINHIENDVYGTKCSSTETNKSFPMHYGLWGGRILKRFLTYLYCSKYNKSNMRHLAIQKHVSYEKFLN